MGNLAPKCGTAATVTFYLSVGIEERPPMTDLLQRSLSYTAPRFVVGALERRRSINEELAAGRDLYAITKIAVHFFIAKVATIIIVVAFKVRLFFIVQAASQIV